MHYANVNVTELTELVLNYNNSESEIHNNNKWINIVNDNEIKIDYKNISIVNERREN